MTKTELLSTLYIESPIHTIDAHKVGDALHLDRFQLIYTINCVGVIRMFIVAND